MDLKIGIASPHQALPCKAPTGDVQQAPAGVQDGYAGSVQKMDDIMRPHPTAAPDKPRISLAERAVGVAALATIGLIGVMAVGIVVGTIAQAM